MTSRTASANTTPGEACTVPVALENTWITISTSSSTAMPRNSQAMKRIPFTGSMSSSRTVMPASTGRAVCSVSNWSEMRLLPDGRGSAMSGVQ
jgi:hypothetical protein